MEMLNFGLNFGSDGVATRGDTNPSSATYVSPTSQLTYSVEQDVLRSHGGRDDRGLSVWKIVVIDNSTVDMLPQDVCWTSTYKMAKILASKLQGASND